MEKQMTALFLKDQTGIFLLFLAQARNTVQMAMVAAAHDPTKSIISSCVWL